MKAEERAYFMMSLVAVLVVVPMGVYGQEEAGGPPATLLTGQMSAGTPPVEQVLVPEGVFAVQLAEALRVGRAQDEAQAESMLSGLGIEPRNGWIAGYPVTPPVIGEIERGVAGAADAGKLGMGKSQALKALGDLKARLGLSVTTAGVVPPSGVQGGTGGQGGSTVIYKYVDKSGVIHYTDRYETIPKEYRDQIEMIRETVQPQTFVGQAGEGTEGQVDNYIAGPSPEVINNYYYDYGPPAVTYYAPPDPYYYLYSWVPYPFWCSGFFFRGFFVLHDFHRRVFVNHRPFVVTNHVINAGTNRVFMVDPVTRSLRASAVSSRVTSAQDFHSPGVQSSARTIVGLSQGRTVTANVAAAPGMAGIASSNSMNRQGQGSSRPGMFNGAGVQPRSNFVASQAAQSRAFNPPPGGKTFSSVQPRVFSSSTFSQGRVFSAPSAGGSRGSLGGSHGGGGFSSRGGSSGGGSRGHR